MCLSWEKRVEGALEGRDSAVLMSMSCFLRARRALRWAAWGSGHSMMWASNRSGESTGGASEVPDPRVHNGLMEATLRSLDTGGLHDNEGDIEVLQLTDVLIP